MEWSVEANSLFVHDISPKLVPSTWYLRTYVTRLTANARYRPPNYREYRQYVVLTLTRIIKSVFAGQAPVTLEWINTQGQNKTKTKWYTYTS